MHKSKRALRLKTKDGCIMGFIDRGPRFAAYYKVSVDSPSGYLYGIHWENSQDCGTFVLNGVTYKLRCILFYKNEFPDAKAQHAESFDVSAIASDDYLLNPVIGAIFTGQIPDISTLHPQAQSLIAQDIASGMSGEEILEARAALFIDFMDFTISDVKSVLPVSSYSVETNETMSVTLDDGTIEEQPVYNETIFKCSFEDVN